MNQDDFLAHFDVREHLNDGALALCPVHEADGNGHNPSLKLGVGDSGKWVWKCRANCTQEAVAAAAGLDGQDTRIDGPTDFTPARSEPVTVDARVRATQATHRWAVALHDAPEDSPVRVYVRDRFGIDASDGPALAALGLGFDVTTNRLTITARRADGSVAFAQQRALHGEEPKYRGLPNDDGRQWDHAGFVGNVTGTRPVVIVEGMSDAVALAALDAYDVATFRGASNAHHVTEIADALTGRTVYLAPDGDDAGAKALDDLTAALSGDVRRVELPAGQDWCNIREAAQGAFQARVEALLGKAKPSNPFYARALSRTALANLPEPEPLILDTLDRNTVAMLAGSWSSYKSFTAMSWAASVATGHDWLGRPSERARVLYVVGEGAQGIHQRFAAWEQETGVEIPDDALTVYPAAVQISNPRALRDLKEYVSNEGFGLMVFDTLARCAVGLDENSAKDMGLFVDAMRELQEATGGTVLVVHHTGKGGAVRGSSAIEGAMDTVYIAEKTGENALRLDRSKRKDGPQEDVLDLRMQPIGESLVVTVVDHTRTTDMEAAANDVESTWRVLHQTFLDATFSNSDAVNALMESLEVKRTNAYQRLSQLRTEDLMDSWSVGRGGSYRNRLKVTEGLSQGLPDMTPLSARLAARRTGNDTDLIDMGGAA